MQSSVDGVEFTDIAVYTPDNLSPDGYQTESLYLPRDVRYVKWIYTEKVAGNVGIGNIHLFEPDARTEITVTDAGWATYVTPFALMFYAEVAYVVTSASTTSVQLEPTGMVCSGTPLLMKGTEGQETIISAYIGNNLEFYAPETNLLKASDGKVKGDGATIYALANMETNGVGFYLVEEGVIIPAGKAYLEISDETAAEGARSFLAIGGDDTTGINAVEKALKQGTEVFDLQGRRVNKALKGLYIMNGQKVVIK